MKKTSFWEKSFSFQTLVLALFFAVLVWLCFSPIHGGVKSLSLGIWFLLLWFYWGREKLKVSSLKKSEKNRELLYLLEKINQAILSENIKEGYGLAYSFFCRLFETETMAFFEEREDIYSLILLHKTPSFDLPSLQFKIDDPLIEKLKTLPPETPFDWMAEFTKKEGGKLLLENFSFKEIFPLWNQGSLKGFFLLPQKTELTKEDKLFLDYAYSQINFGTQIRKLNHQLKISSQKLEQSTQRIQLETQKLNQQLKRKVFDLHALFQVGNNLFATLDKDRLIYTFMKVALEHLEAKSVLLFFPQEESGNLVPAYAKGVELKDFSHLVIEKTTPLYQALIRKNEILNLYALAKDFPQDKVLTPLMGQGFQLSAQMSIKPDWLGLVFLGEKADGSRFNIVDLEAFFILANIVAVSLDNIRQYRTIEELSYTDSMTGLYNYRYFYKRLTEEIFRAKRFNRKLALVIFDIDDFKVYNDTYGHQAGDSVLKQLGKLLSNTVRSIDVTCRYGGEEFCVIMPETDQIECFQFMERLRKVISEYSFVDDYLGGTHQITISVGAAIYPSDAKQPDRLIYCADMALLKAKNSGKNNVVLYREEKSLIRQV